MLIELADEIANGEVIHPQELKILYDSQAINILKFLQDFDTFSNVIYCETKGN